MQKFEDNEGSQIYWHKFNNQIISSNQRHTKILFPNVVQRALHYDSRVALN